jgi:hypothetical protein
VKFLSGRSSFVAASEAGITGLGPDHFCGMGHNDVLRYALKGGKL